MQIKKRRIIIETNDNKMKKNTVFFVQIKKEKKNEKKIKF